jgi:hypothetical protein
MQENQIILREGSISTAPQFSPNTPIIGFFEVRQNDVGKMAALLSVDDAAIATTVDRAIIRMDVSPTGVISNEQVLIKEGDVLPGMGTQTYVDAASTSPQGFAFNNLGQIMHNVDGSGATTEDTAVFIDNTPIAIEGSPSGAVAGRNWGNFSSPRVELNNVGDWVLASNLDSSNTANDSIIVKNGVKVIQGGDLAPGVAGGWTLTGFGTGTVDMDDAGNVYWFGDWNDPTTAQDTGIYMNSELLVQEGVTMINGSLLTSIATVQDNFFVSDNGQWMIFEGVLQGTGDALIIVQLPEPASATALLALGGLALRRSRRGR